MAQFKCRLIDSSGKITEEVLKSDSKEELNSYLRTRGYSIISIEEEKKSLAQMEIGSKKLKNKDLTLFCRQMATLLRAGVPLIQCFSIIEAQTESKMLKAMMNVLSSQIQSGLTLSAAMETHPDQFPKMLSEMVKIGEATGDLSGILERMAFQYESDARMTRKIRGALTYPVAIIFIAIAACVFMLIKVVPQFVDVFNSLGSDLPSITKLLLNISDFIVEKWLLALLFLPLLVVALSWFFKQPKVSYWIDKQMLSLRLLKTPMRKIMAARFARNLHTLLVSGVPIVQALGYTKKNVRNQFAENAITEIAQGISKGKGISVQMQNYGIFPQMLTSMISIGEASGSLEEMLSKTADYFDEEMDASISQLTTLIEPVMIVFVGIIIGGLVMALYAPMFGAITAMQSSV